MATRAEYLRKLIRAKSELNKLGQAVIKLVNVVQDFRASVDDDINVNTTKTISDCEIFFGDIDNLCTEIKDRLKTARYKLRQEADTAELKEEGQ